MTAEQDEFSWEALRPFYAELFDQLASSPAFIEFFATNFDLDIVVDDDAQSIGVALKAISEQEIMQRTITLQKHKLDQGPQIITPDKRIIL